MAVDSNLWYVPYNRGFSDIGGASFSWDSVYPELVLIWFDFQYIRPFFGSTDGPDEYDFSDQCARLQVKLDVDGVLYPGTGPFATSQDGKIRGTGFAGIDLRTYVSLSLPVSAGRHTVTAKAALAPSVQVDGEFSNPAFNFMDQGLYPGPAIAGRKLVVLHHPFGTSLGA